MTKDISARKRRRVEPTETLTRSEETGGAVVFDDEAMKRHMLSLMQNAKSKPSSQGSDSEDEEEAEGSSDEEDVTGSEESGGEEAGSSAGPAAVVDSDEEDLDETARALLTSHKPASGNAEHDGQTASRISRVPTERKAEVTPKKPILKSTFESLGLSVQLIRTLAGISIRKPTEIQSACFEPILSGTSFRKPCWWRY